MYNNLAGTRVTLCHIIIPESFRHIWLVPIKPRCPVKVPQCVRAPLGFQTLSCSTRLMLDIPTVGLSRSNIAIIDAWSVKSAS